MALQPKLVCSVDHLRYLVEQAELGEKLAFMIADNVSLEEARKLWGAVSLDGGHGELMNIEVLRGKMDASDFISVKILELVQWRDVLNGHIGAINSWCKLMERSLATGGPGIPTQHEALMLHGPNVYLNLNQFSIGAVDGGAHRHAILPMFHEVRPPAAMPYWSNSLCRARELADRQSLMKFNLRYLKIKIAGLKALKDQVCAGIESLKKEVFNSRMYVGCGNTDFGDFRDVDMVDVHGIGN